MHLKQTKNCNEDIFELINKTTLKQNKNKDRKNKRDQDGLCGGPCPGFHCIMVWCVCPDHSAPLGCVAQALLISLLECA